MRKIPQRIQKQTGVTSLRSIDTAAQIRKNLFLNDCKTADNGVYSAPNRILSQGETDDEWPDYRDV